MFKQLTLLFFAVVFFACTSSDNPEKQQLQTEITSLESDILKTGDASEKKEVAKELVEKTRQFARNYPEDENTPGLLFKAADVARGAKDYGKAVMLWGELWRNYSDHPHAPMALFLQGFTFDADLGNSKMATKYYKDFLKKYPNDSLATQVKQLLSVVDLKPEDLVKQFETE